MSDAEKGAPVVQKEPVAGVEAALKASLRALRAPLDGWKGELEAQALELVNAALATQQASRVTTNVTLRRAVIHRESGYLVLRVEVGGDEVPDDRLLDVLRLAIASPCGSQDSKGESK